MANSFADRLKIAFEGATMAEMARRLGIGHPTIRNYVQENRLPAPEVLIKIANETNVSLNWLLTGEGEKFVTKISEENIDNSPQILKGNSPIFDQTQNQGRSNRIDLNQVVREIVNEELDKRLPLSLKIADRMAERLTKEDPFEAGVELAPRGKTKILMEKESPEKLNKKAG